MCEQHPGKMVTEREAVERERGAFVNGARWHLQLPSWFNVAGGNVETSAEHAARQRYPLPTVRRLRQVPDNPEGLATQYRYNPDLDVYEARLAAHYAPWMRVHQVPVFMVTALADLKANPWEMVNE